MLPRGETDPQRILLEKRYQQLVESISDAVYILSPEGLLTYLSPAFEASTGWTRADWEGQPYKLIIHPDDLPIAMERFQQLLNGELVPPFSIRVLNKSGDYSTREFTAMAEQDGEQVVSVWGLVRKIKGAEGEIVHRNQRSELTDLIKATVYNAKDILSSISLNTHFLDQQAISQQDLSTYKQKLSGQVHYLGRLVNGLLLLSQFEAERIQLIHRPVDVNGLLDMLTSQFKRATEAKSIRVEFEPTTALPTILADMSYLQQALVQILENATEHARSHIIVRSAIQDQYVRIEIEDDGPGIEAEFMPHIFETFVQGNKFRSDATKMGLGLAIARQIIQLHRGSIEVKSEVGVGTTFKLLLPVEETPEP